MGYSPYSFMYIHRLKALNMKRSKLKNDLILLLIQKNVCRFNHTVTIMSGQGNVSKGMSSMQTKNL